MYLWSGLECVQVYQTYFLCAVSPKLDRSRDNQAVDTYLLVFKLAPTYNDNKLPIIIKKYI